MNNLVTTFEGITVGDTICNPDVGTFTVVAINESKDRILLMNQNPNAFNRYIGAWALQKKTNSDAYYWGQGHYFGGQLQAATEYVLGNDDKVEEVDDIIIVVEDGMVQDVFATKKHNVVIIDMDCNDGDLYEDLDVQVSDIRNGSKYQLIY